MFALLIFFVCHFYLLYILFLWLIFGLLLLFIFLLLESYEFYFYQKEQDATNKHQTAINHQDKQSLLFSLKFKDICYDYCNNKCENHRSTIQNTNNLCLTYRKAHFTTKIIAYRKYAFKYKTKTCTNYNH